MHHEAEMNNIAPKLCELFRARPPLPYFKPMPKANYKRRGLAPLIDKNLPGLD